MTILSRDIALSFAGMPAFNTAPAHDPQQSLDRSLRQALILVLVLISARQTYARGGGGTAPGSLGRPFHALR